jgi:flavin reductase (DIM6/NTAB) family NADH-FMN oxidoreductase RutF
MDIQAKKKALRMFTYGVYLLGMKQDTTYNASTVSWVSQVSFEPPLVMVALRNDSLTLGMVLSSKSFTINLLSDRQEEMAGKFFKQATYEDGKLNGYAFEPGVQTSAPIFADAPAWLECRVLETLGRGDHTVVIAEVVDAGVRDEGVVPLALRDTPWQYGG